MDPLPDLLTERLAAVIVAAVFAFFISWIAGKYGYYRLPMDDSKGKRIPHWNCVLKAFCIFLFIQIFLLSLIYFIWIYWEQGVIADPKSVNLSVDIQGWLSLLMIILTGFALVSLFASLNKPTRDAIWGSPSSSRNIRKNLKDFLLGSVTWLIAYPWIVVIGQIVGIFISLLYSGPLSDQAAVKHLKGLFEHPILFGVTGIAVVTIIPFIEEFLFRGFLQSWLKTLIGRTQAILLTSIIFASFHFSVSQGIENIEFILSLFFLACYLGFVKERQQSLWASIGLHSTFNFISILMLIF